MTSTLSAPITITVGIRPVGAILTPTHGSGFRAGDVITFSGSATDAEDGNLAASAFSWTVVFHHETHIHPVQGPLTNTFSGNFTIPTSGHDFSGNTSYEILLTVTDSDGLQHTSSVYVYPDKVNLTFATSPTGIPVLIDGLSRSTPFILDSLIGFQHTIEVAAQATIGTTSYGFDSWSDGGARSHPITAPESATTYTATFTVVDVTAPTVTAVSPLNGAIEVVVTTTVSVTFDEPVDPTTVTPATFELRDPAGVLVSASVSYDAATRTATLTPAVSLAASTSPHSVRVRGGAAGVKDLAGNPLAADFTWSFTTGVPPMTVGGDPQVDGNGVRYYSVVSAYQGPQPTFLRILAPDNPEPGEPPRFLYLLPAASGLTDLGSEFGDGLEQARVLNLHNLYNATLVAPSFHIEPWYGDHASDPTRRLESFLVRHVVPFVDQFAAQGTTPARWLVGFSKSGNGALSLIFRNPEVFHAAAAWDAPVQFTDISNFDMAVNFGTDENFDAYEIPTLVAERNAPFLASNRLWISGDESNWTVHMQTLHQQLEIAGIPHTYADGVVRPHHWNSGWLELAVQALDAASSPPPNQAPTAILQATPTSGVAPLLVSFNASGSFDPDSGDTLSYAWDLDGDGAFDDSTASQPTFTYTAPGQVLVSLRVTDNHGASSTATVTISVGSRPTAVINTPAATLTWRVGDVISFTGQATDPEDGLLAASALSWSLLLHHGTQTTTLQTFSGVAGGTFTAPNQEYPAHLELQLTATDSTGLTDTTSILLQPQTVSLTVQTSPAGLQVSLGSASGTGPMIRAAIIGSQSTLTTPSSQASGGTTYQFVSWSDGGASTHIITAPATATTYTATFTPVGPSGLVGAYGFNEGTGTTLLDSSGNGLNGVVSGATWSAAGKYGG
ncbi:MAG: Ig-like domain-containing protein, partial [Gemmataceae bacterium]|nr:Ig-like domain-containing protein [Gemmataceae bacterium]